MLVTISRAEACMPPLSATAARVSRATINKSADRIFAEANYVAEVIVVRSPRFRLLDDKSEPPPGLLRVTAIIKGIPPPLLSVPRPDPCLLYFGRVGERWIVFARSRSAFPLPLGPQVVASLRHRNIGHWSDVGD